MESIIAEVIVAVLALLGTLVGSIMTSQKTTWRIDQLEKKMDVIDRKMEKHNQVIDRVTKLEMKDQAQWKWIDEFKKELERVDKE